MEFNVFVFGNKFRDAIDWMLKGSYGYKIRDDLNQFKNNKKELAANPDCESALRLIMELKVTNSWYRKKPDSFDDEMTAFLTKNKGNLRTPTAMGEMTSLIQRNTIFQRDKNAEIEAWVQHLLGDFTSIKEATEDLYQSIITGSHKPWFSDKGGNNYLRDFGYWDVVPIDIHQKRFIFRTGIYHSLTIKGSQDPLDNISLIDSFRRFCNMCLKDMIVDNIDVGQSPGIADIFVWSYSARERYAMCGRTPKCASCILATTCLYQLTNIEHQLLNSVPTSQDYPQDSPLHAS